MTLIWNVRLPRVACNSCCLCTLLHNWGINKCQWNLYIAGSADSRTWRTVCLLLERSTKLFVIPQKLSQTNCALQKNSLNIGNIWCKEDLQKPFSVCRWRTSLFWGRRQKAWKITRALNFNIYIWLVFFVNWLTLTGLGTAPVFVREKKVRVNLWSGMSIMQD